MENDYYKRYEPFFGSWYIRRFIGKGSYGRVFEIERKDAFGTVYTGALKAITVPTSEDELENLLANGMDRDSASTYFRNYAEGLNREIALMSRLKGHSNIVSYEDHDIRPHEDGMGWDMLIRMELLTPITSFQKANKPFTRRQVIQLGIDLCRALEVCQKYNIIHRDIKPANIFLSETGDFKLGDFGVARIASASTGASTRAGTVNYMAPEVFRSEKYTSNVDLYSLGLVMYQLLNANRMPLCPPYPQLMTPDQWEQANARRLSGTALPPPVNADGRLAEIVLKACAPNSAGRYETPALMRQALEAILYTEQETKDIYPEGDALPLPETGEKAPSAPRPGTDGETVNVWVKMREAGGEPSPAEPLPAAGTLTEKAPAKQELGPEREKAPETAPHEAGNETQVLFKAQEEARRKAEEAARRDEEARRAAEETARQAESARREREEARRKAEEERQAKARKAEMQIEPTGKAPAERMHPTPKKNRKPLVIGGVVTAAVIAACCFAVLNGSKASVPVASASAETSEQASMIDSAVVVELPAAASAAESESTSREESASTSIPESSSVSRSKTVNSTSTASSGAASGNCGKNAKWVLQTDGTLSISGSGAMWDFDWEKNHWLWHNELGDPVKEIKTAVIENGITTIGADAFFRCSSLKSISISGSIANIGEGAFHGCKALTAITLPSGVTNIRRWTFQGCSSLSEIVIPESIVEIGTYAFYGCESLGSIKIPSGIRSIEDGVFSGCNALNFVVIPDGVTSIGEGAFWDCTSLSSITIPRSVTKIGKWAFRNCDSLTSVTISRNCTVEEEAFESGVQINYYD